MEVMVLLTFAVKGVAVFASMYRGLERLQSMGSMSYS